jgi:hypothetical protein
LRLFAFAMRGERVPRPSRRRARTVVTLLSDGVEVARVRLAATTFERLVGLIGSPGREGLLMRASCVHGWFLRRPLVVLGLDGEGTLVGKSLLRPWRFVRIPGAAWIAELPPTAHLGEPCHSRWHVHA